MAGGKIQAPRGTFDVLPEDGRRRELLRRSSGELFGAAGYGPVETPIFESTELFARGVGETTDIVQKEMFTFEDQGGRSLTLRPEGTAGVCRAYLEHGMHKLPQPVKLWYWGPFFRHEAPQAGRYRQFNQVGVEAIGSLDPSLDAEVILLLADLLARAGARGVRLRLSSLGTPETRNAYSDELRDYLRAHESELSEDVRGRIDANPLRAFDADHEGTRAVMRDAPKLLERLSPEDAEHFAAVRALLDAAGQKYDVDPTLVRGIDYYTRTVFEFTSDALGAQSGVGGGGRYDGLIEQLGGPATPGVGFAAGIERILLVSELAAGEEAPDVFISYTSSDSGEAFRLALELRQRGVSTQFEQAGRSLKGQLKQADRVGAGWVLLIDGGLQLRDMRTGEQRPIGGVDEAVQAVNGS
jgi:histidyl-tRNA synthetase